MLLKRDVLELSTVRFVNLPDFVPLSLKPDNPYYHITQKGTKKRPRDMVAVKKGHSNSLEIGSEIDGLSSVSLLLQLQFESLKHE